MKEVLKGSLEGIKVIDFSTLLPGPLASLFLSETGAEVIKIEKPGSGDEIRLSNPQWGEQSVSFSLLNRGKKSLSLDLKDPKNLKILTPILKEADIKNLKAENFKRYGSARKLYNFKVDNIGNY